MTPEKIEQIIRSRWYQQEHSSKCKVNIKKQQHVGCVRLIQKEMHWMSACPYLAGSEYLKRQNQALKVFYVALANKVGLLDPKLAWLNVRIAPVAENDEASIHWNIKLAIHITVEHRWPNLRVEWN